MRIAARLKDERVRLTVLLGLLTLLLAYAVTGWTSGNGGGDVDGRSGLGPSGPGPNGCAMLGAPDVRTVPRAEVGELRESLRKLVSPFPRLHSYEEGAIASSTSWTDAQPGVHRSLPRRDRVPGGYEMRWRMPNRYDVVADAMVFASAGEARELVRRALGVKCRSAAAAVAAPFPPGGHNLAWRNPSGFAEEDVYLRRGSFVYRVVVVKAGARAKMGYIARNAAFELVDALACMLPRAGCRASSRNVSV